MLELRDVTDDRRGERLAEIVERVAARRVASRYLDPDVARTQVRPTQAASRSRICLAMKPAARAGASR